MQFALDEDRALLARSTRELLEKEAPLATNRQIMESEPSGYSKALFRQLGELGYPSLLLNEAEGGLGPVAFAAVLQEMGRVALPGPFLDLALAIRVLAGCGADAAKPWLARASAGEALVVLARGESLASGDPSAPSASFTNGRVRGLKRFVPFGAEADALIVEAANGLALVEKPAGGWNAKALPTIDHAQRFAELALDAPGELLCDAAAARAALDEVDRLAALGASALLLGLSERALEITLAYTQERQAFGVPIASFQALQHRAADMLLQTESTRAAVYRAAFAAEHQPEQAAYLIAVAKAWSGPAARLVCGEALQMHGGVGFTWEYDPHVYLKRVKTLEQFYGSTRAQLERVLQSRGW
ncbi:MAG TPA: acyl-CoA dehydrogenase family protein [Myxococcota bacterium]|nr:acyl-CoA dehydrogenase family protein [Myxococcota bacterium]